MKSPSRWGALRHQHAASIQLLLHFKTDTFEISLLAMRAGVGFRSSLLIGEEPAAPRLRWLVSGILQANSLLHRSSRPQCELIQSHGRVRSSRLGAAWLAGSGKCQDWNGRAGGGPAHQRSWQARAPQPAANFQRLTEDGDRASLPRDGISSTAAPGSASAALIHSRC